MSIYRVNCPECQQNEHDVYIDHKRDFKRDFVHYENITCYACGVHYKAIVHVIVETKTTVIRGSQND